MRRSLLTWLVLFACGEVSVTPPAEEFDSGVEALRDAGEVVDAGPGGPAPISFDRDIWPVLRRDCAGCHDTANIGDFRTATSAYTALTDPNRRSGSMCRAASEPVLQLVVPGSPEDSGLWHLIAVGYRGCGGVYGMPKGDGRGLLIDFDPDTAVRIQLWIREGA
ncbi:MAG: hypothetical protein JNG84_01380, partial [Archangium sp.]|nr:hypothetical protein [Archangium sp.]